MADLQLKRGTTLKHSTFTGKVGEATIDTDKDTLVVHDGSTVGGFPIARESALNTHTARTDNPHVVTKAQVGLGNAENTADADKVVASAGKLTTGRTISLSGDATGSVSFDGSANVNVVVAVDNDSHTHAFGNITSKPTTLAGYGITDAYTKTEVDTITNNLDALPSQTGFAGKYLKTDGTVATWESASSSTGTWLSTFDFVATSGQTVFSIVYVPGNIDVHHNGLLLSKGDYVATNGTSVVLNTEASVSDVISITVYDTFDVANTYTKGEIDLVIGSINAALDIINGEVI